MHQQFEHHLFDNEEQRIEIAFQELTEVLAPNLFNFLKMLNANYPRWAIKQRLC
jgi:hypothetical protein